jgi:hypothetical protein
LPSIDCNGAALDPLENTLNSICISMWKNTPYRPWPRPSAMKSIYSYHIFLIDFLSYVKASIDDQLARTMLCSSARSNGLPSHMFRVSAFVKRARAFHSDDNLFLVACSGSSYPLPQCVKHLHMPVQASALGFIVEGVLCYDDPL